MVTHLLTPTICMHDMVMCAVSLVGVLDCIQRPCQSPLPRQACQISWAGHLEGVHSTAFWGSLRP